MPVPPLKPDLTVGAGAASAARGGDRDGRSRANGGPTGPPRVGGCGSFCAEGDEQPAAASGAANAKVQMRAVWCLYRLFDSLVEGHCVRNE